MSAMSLALEILGRDLTGGAFASVLARLSAIEGAAAGAGRGGSEGLGQMADTLQAIEGATIGAGVAFIGFSLGVKAAVDAGAQLQQAGTMASIAISDGAKHVGELEDAIVNLANTSQYKIADVDMAFRTLGGLGFDTGQILGGLGEQAIILAQAMGGPGAGVSAADAAQLLGQAIYLFGQHGLTAAHAADVLTGAFYNNMMSVSDLTQYLGMAGGTASSLGVSFDQLMTFGSMLTPMFGSASSAGASLAYMMRNLAHPATSKMADEIKHLGLQIYDSQGNFVGLKNIMDQLFEKTQGMSMKDKMDVFGTLFNVRSGRAAMDMMSQTQAQFDATYNRIDGRLTQVGQAQRDSNAINNTGIGTWQRLTTTVNDFFAKAGLLIVGALIPLGNQLNNIFSALQKNPTVERFFAAFLVGGAILAGVTLVVVAIIAAFAFFGTIAGWALGIIGGIVLAAGLLGALFTMLTTHTNLFSGALSFLNPVVDFFRMLWSRIGDLWQTVILPLLNAAMPAIKVIGIALLVVAGVILGVVLVALTVLAMLISAVILVVLALGAAIVWVVSHLGEWFGDIGSIIGGALGAAGNAITSWWNGVAGFFQSLPEKLRELAMAMIQGFMGGIASMLPGAQGGVINFFNGVLGAIKGVLRIASPSGVMFDIGVYSAQGFQAGMTSQQGATNARMAAAGTAAGNSFKGGVDATRVPVTQSGYDLLNSLQNATANMNARTQMFNNGQAIIAGFIAGLRSMNEQLAQALNDFNDAVIKVTNRGLGIHSPSTVFAEIGQHVVSGFIRGLTDGKTAISETLDDVFLKSQGNLVGSLPGITPAVTPVGGFPTRGAQGQQVVIPIYIGQDIIAEYGYNTVTQQLTMNGMGRQFR